MLKRRGEVEKTREREREEEGESPTSVAQGGRWNSHSSSLKLLPKRSSIRNWITSLPPEHSYCFCLGWMLNWLRNLYFFPVCVANVSDKDLDWDIVLSLPPSCPPCPLAQLSIGCCLLLLPLRLCTTNNTVSQSVSHSLINQWALIDLLAVLSHFNIYR